MVTIIGVLSILEGAHFNDSPEESSIGFWNYAPVEVFDEAKTPLGIPDCRVQSEE